MEARETVASALRSFFSFQKSQAEGEELVEGLGMRAEGWCVFGAGCQLCQWPWSTAEDILAQLRVGCGAMEVRTAPPAPVHACVCVHKGTGNVGGGKCVNMYVSVCAWVCKCVALV